MKNIDHAASAGDRELAGVRKLSRRNRWKTDNRVEVWRGEKVVVKDCSVMPPWYRYLFGIRQLRREYRALEALADFATVPSVRRWVSPTAFAMQWMEGTSIRSARGDRNLSFICEQLHQCVAKMHRLGVAHCDLHQSNILVTPDRQVRIVDLATAVERSGVPAWVWAYATYLDWVAVGKFYRLYSPARFRQANAPWLIPPPFGYRTIHDFFHRTLRRRPERIHATLAGHYPQV
ncbi:MAG: hypothetical protein AUJ92_08815 [Armatimonadetes bacterium CG2_30_59_28]|nr:hypothetical protein [Armatimonadota bacterium]OIO94985.1 MAG: hypothetical protein AUJ92_08815 [Armatimonadetes bacterium CG2_30_59_28]PIU66771.1 MAG: hypothetical protein COS85_03365 [Armatimonadetes bacterium CG07_land_8_20_14_0_80_59_28]PIX39072.1 MAG: hypothetical protein COZ56_18710 [Armatimonadetes bacterium CG_4_8_14_3_um_filter_58_9]PIY39330.1 MAG: hypothetical protein COZ05_19385 [Armatimonadetes bacterium CG_4_10_14_3_um_filter_59_10]PJB64498.1 MAG: hypothetical protein CO095_148